MTDRQVKSRARVAEHGEVFTAEREVNAMLDLVKQETERIDSRFLEPACGDGNFLAEVLRRKLAVVKRQYGKSTLDYEKYAVVAITSIYGVELLQDNVDDCRKRLFDIWNTEYTAKCKKDCNDECREAVRYILSHNILCGNALTLKKVNAQGQDTDSPIIFAEWEMVTGTMLKRRDFRLDVLIEAESCGKAEQNQLSLLDDGPSNMDYWMTDPETQKPIPKPIHEYPLTDYRKVHENG